MDEFGLVKPFSNLIKFLQNLLSSKMCLKKIFFLWLIFHVRASMYLHVLRKLFLLGNVSKTFFNNGKLIGKSGRYIR